MGVEGGWDPTTCASGQGGDRPSPPDPRCFDPAALPCRPSFYRFKRTSPPGQQQEERQQPHPLASDLQFIQQQQSGGATRGCGRLRQPTGSSPPLFSRNKSMLFLERRTSECHTSSSVTNSNNSSSATGGGWWWWFIVLVVGMLLLPGSDAVLNMGNPDAKRLYDDLLSNYNKLVRPVQNTTDPLTVRIKLKLSQLIDVVSIHSVFFTINLCTTVKSYTAAPLSGR